MSVEEMLKLPFNELAELYDNAGLALDMAADEVVKRRGKKKAAQEKPLPSTKAEQLAADMAREAAE